MDVTMSSSVTVASPLLLLRSPPPASPRSPPPHADGISIYDARTPQLDRSESSLSSDEMDMAASVPFLPTTVIPYDQESQMVDVEDMTHGNPSAGEGAEPGAAQVPAQNRDQASTHGQGEPAWPPSGGGVPQHQDQSQQEPVEVGGARQLEHRSEQAGAVRAGSEIQHGPLNEAGDAMDTAEPEAHADAAAQPSHNTAGSEHPASQTSDSALSSQGSAHQPPPAPVISTPPPDPPAQAPSERESSAENAEAAAYAYSDTSTDTELETPTRPNFVEDTSVPDEEELKVIEGRPERTATDHDYFERKAFRDLDDPEYVPAEVGRIHWTISNFRGSQEHPNTEAVMRSPRVRIGHLDWNIQVYPNGNNTDHVSVYLEASNPNQPSIKVEEQPESGPAGAAESPGPSRDTQSASAEPADVSMAVAPSESLSDANAPGIVASEDHVEPVPDETSSSQRDDSTSANNWGAAAQFAVVMYNPSEPRVYVSHTMHHRFCHGSPDWGWTRFHGPQQQLHKRQRGQRQAMLRNDTLAFTAYVRIIKDDTHNLWEHQRTSDSNRSLYHKTGMRPLGSGSLARSQLVAAIASWSLLAPFRKTILGAPTQAPVLHAQDSPRGLVIALQRVLYQMERRRSSPVSLEEISDFLAIRGAKGLNFDVVEFWEVLRRKLEEELRGTEMEGKLGELFDGALERSSSEGAECMNGTVNFPLSAGRPPSFRVPAKGVQSVQAAIRKVLDGEGEVGRASLRKLPRFLQLELDRREFDESSREWRKVVDRVEYDDRIDLAEWTDADAAETRYTLYGLIVHEGDVHSDLYHAILRPGGPGTRWYAYLQENGTDKVICRTHKQAVLSNQGVAPGDKAEGVEPVAYVVMYVRDDVAGEVLQGAPAKSQIPQWILDEKNRPSFAAEDPVNLHIFHSNIFTDRVERGLFDIYTERPAGLPSGQTIQLSLPGTMSFHDVQKEVAKAVDGVDDPKQCQMWRFDALLGPFGRVCDKPILSHTLAAERRDWPQMQYWLHVIPRDAFKKGSSPRTWPTARTAEPTAPAQDISSTSAPIITTADELLASIRDRVGLVMPRDQFEAFASAQRQMNNPPTSSEALGDASMMEASWTVPPATAAEPTQPTEQMDVTIEGDSRASDETTTTMDHTPTASEPAPSVPPPETPGETQGAVEVHDREPRDDSIYVFIKRFDVNDQVLRGVGSYLAEPRDEIVSGIRKVLGLPDEHKLEVEIEAGDDERDLPIAEIDSTMTFRDAQLIDGDILVVDDVLSPEQRDKLEKEGQLTSGRAYLELLKRRDHSSLPTDGQITRRYFSGDAYTGQVRHGLYHGQGTHISSWGDVYTGSFVAGKRRGHGRMRFHNSDEYAGEWRDDAMHGQGRLVYAKTGNTYVGGFRAGRRHGRGRMEYLVADDEMQLCQICYEEEIDCLFYDCGHVCACFGCAAQLADCPVCRKTVVKVVKMYRS